MKIAPVEEGPQAIANNAPEPDEVDPVPDQVARLRATLPIPARFVIDREEIIRSADADPDYTRRTEPAATVTPLGELRMMFAGWFVSRSDRLITEA